MQNPRAPRITRPKFSTMPRTKTEASEQLELYKMVTKRQRIQQELNLMEQRIQVLKKQLNVLDNQIEDTEQSIQKSRQSIPTSTEIPTGQTIQKLRQSTPSPTPSQTAPNSDPKSTNFQTFYLEY